MASWRWASSQGGQDVIIKEPLDAKVPAWAQPTTYGDGDIVVTSHMLPPKGLEVLDCPSKPEYAIGIIRDFLSSMEVAAVSELAWGSAPQPKAQGNVDSLNYKVRIERQLRYWRPKLFERFVNACRGADGRLWHKIPLGCTISAELEYIEHDAQVGKGKYVIEPHCDDGTLVTLLVSLSEPTDYSGGANFFDDGTESGRKVALKAGDAVIVNGEECQHGIAPLTSGRRAILRMELYQVGQMVWHPLLLAWFCAVVPAACAAFSILAVDAHRGFWVCVLAVLAIAAYSFGDRSRLAPALRKSTWMQAMIVVAMLALYIALFGLPFYLEYWYNSAHDRVAVARTARAARAMSRF